MGERFVDILLPRRTESGIFNFMTRAWNPRKTLKLDKYLNPQELKDVTANSVYLDAVIEAQSFSTGVSKEELKREVRKYLDEMGLDRKLYVIRWMGVVFLKLSFMMKVGIYVNEPAILKLRQSMGQNPVLFLPTHRSYADFCLMTYLCYHYDIDLPAVAAGMDFYSMAVVGRSMRDTCAFYIRRSLVGAPLYAATLAQYVRTVVAHNCAPIEFFVEGTRSRSNKSLPPKYGMLSMSLAPLFSGEVTDVTIVPVNISYDRLVEHGLFAYEHLGVPKPKESTGGLLKAIYRLNQHFGNVYINMGEPFSAKQYLKYDPSEKEERLKPIHLQQITSQQFKIVQDIADRVVQLQQKCTVVTISNLVSLVLMESVIKNTVLIYDEVLKEVEYMMLVLKKLGAKIFEDDVKKDVDRIMVVHDKMMKFDSDKKLRLISSVPMDVTKDVQMKMKGHILKTETMVNAIPLIQLQLYVNPVLHYLVPAAIVSLIVNRGPVTEEQLSIEYKQVRKLLRQELFYLEETEEEVFKEAIKFCTSEDLIRGSASLYIAGADDRLRHLLHCAVWPSLTTLSKCALVLRELTRCEHKKALKLVQERVEASECHPYCLSLESISNCISGLVSSGAVQRNRLDETVTYEVVPDIMDQSIKLVNSIYPRISANFGKSNLVIFDQRIKTSRL